ncbi:MAG: serine acetyltransferase [Candidatus Delongbacteria bacterium]|nr:serine acetyltransferase [Candidatus Delongbacteria bacterium]MBN2835782.1 serine acetyltransferase [Candidatus Delongbacteria bacterium]
MNREEIYSNENSMENFINDVNRIYNLWLDIVVLKKYQLLSELSQILKYYMIISNLNVFLSELEKIILDLENDLEFIFSKDPAAISLDEIRFSYLGFHAITIYRIANLINNNGNRFFARRLSFLSQKETAIDIHPAATILSPFAIDHGTGIVIGETTFIGRYVTLYHGVTLGALSVKRIKAGQKRHPTIENNVTIYANSTILGGETIIGQNSIIGCNTVISEKILPKSIIHRQMDIFNVSV